MTRYTNGSAYKLSGNLMAKKILIIFACLIILAGNCLAIKIREMPFVSDVHLGFVSGIGTGLNFGFDAGINVNEKLMIGPEIEQVITDIDYASDINATRLGLYLNYDLSEYVEKLAFNLHYGSTGFYVSKNDIRYEYQGKIYYLLANNSYSGQYLAFSLDYPLGEFFISPKLVINSIHGGGSFNEIDLNVGRKF